MNATVTYLGNSATFNNITSVARLTELGEEYLVLTAIFAEEDVLPEWLDPFAKRVDNQLRIQAILGLIISVTPSL